MGYPILIRTCSPHGVCHPIAASVCIITLTLSSSIDRLFVVVVVIFPSIYPPLSPSPSHRHRQSSPLVVVVVIFPRYTAVRRCRWSSFRHRHRHHHRRRRHVVFIHSCHRLRGSKESQNCSASPRVLGAEGGKEEQKLGMQSTAKTTKKSCATIVAFDSAEWVGYNKKPDGTIDKIIEKAMPKN